MRIPIRAALIAPVMRQATNAPAGTRTRRGGRCADRGRARSRSRPGRRSTSSGQRRRPLDRSGPSGLCGRDRRRPGWMRRARSNSPGCCRHSSSINVVASNSQSSSLRRKGSISVAHATANGSVRVLQARAVVVADGIGPSCRPPLARSPLVRARLPGPPLARVAACQRSPPASRRSPGAGPLARRPVRVPGSLGPPLARAARPGRLAGRPPLAQRHPGGVSYASYTDARGSEPSVFSFHSHPMPKPREKRPHGVIRCLSYQP